MLKLRESFDNDQYLRGIRREYQYDEDISWRHVVDNMSLSDGESPGRGHMRHLTQSLDVILRRTSAGMDENFEASYGECR